MSNQNLLSQMSPAQLTEWLERILARCLKEESNPDPAYLTVLDALRCGRMTTYVLLEAEETYAKNTADSFETTDFLGGCAINSARSVINDLATTDPSCFEYTGQEKPHPNEAVHHAIDAATAGACAMMAAKEQAGEEVGDKDRMKLAEEEDRIQRQDAEDILACEPQ